MSDGLNDDDFDSLAAEFVLGTLDADERTRANVLLDVDHAFRSKVRTWERRLGELHLMVEPVEPDQQIWERLKGKIGGFPAPSAPAEPVQPAPQPAPPASPSELERQIEEDLTAAPAPKFDPMAELEKALEEVRAQKTERSQTPTPAPAAPPLVPAERSPPSQIQLKELDDLKAAAELGRPPEPARTSAPETISRGPPKPGLEAWSPSAESPPPAGDPQAPPAGSGIPLEARTLDLTEAQVVPSEAGRRRLRRWRLMTLFMTLLTVLLGGLISAWRYAPERLPPSLRPTAVLNLPAAPAAPAAPPKRLPPPGSEFYE